MKKHFFIQSFCLLILISCFTSCSKWLDVNENPNAPQEVNPSLYLPAIENNIALGVQFDARALGQIVQNWHYYTTSSSPTSYYRFDQHGFISSSDAAGEIWRSIYWKMGKNNINLMEGAKALEQWDLLGVGAILQAYGWQILTDYHGDIILDEVYDETQNQFPYTSQEKVYSHVKTQAHEAIDLLSRNDGALNGKNFVQYDQVYKGDRKKWKKFAYGLLAINGIHLINKTSFNADSVISYVDSAFAGNSDNFLIPFTGAGSADANFLGPLRNNWNVYLQSGFIVRLLEGTKNGNVYPKRDPRILGMLSTSLDGEYRGTVPANGQPKGLSANQVVRTFWGTAAAGTPGATVPQPYVFGDKAPFPIMTYSQLQFIKAEAALKKGDKAMALDAFTKGVNAHIDYVAGTITDAATLTKFNTLKTAYLADPLIVPTSPSDLKISHIMTQKYIAQFGWGLIETWCDLRKYNYNGEVFTSFSLPEKDLLLPENGGLPAQRFRPRYNSEYIYNIESLKKIGAFDDNYHTKPMWFSQP